MLNYFQELQAALDKANKILDDIDAIENGIGPGSFTGLRVGLGFAKGLAYSKSLPIIPVPSMLSLAFSLKNEPKQGILHSHGNKIFFQTFGWVDNTSLKDNLVFLILTLSSIFYLWVL